MTWGSKVANFGHKAATIGLISLTCWGAYVVSSGAFFIVNKRMNMPKIPAAVDSSSTAGDAVDLAPVQAAAKDQK